MTKKNQEFFFELIRAGLWGTGNPEVRIDETTDWIYMYRLAQEQSVQGLVLQGGEWFKNHNDSLNIPQFLLLQWIGEVQVIEQRNKAMNSFVAQLIDMLRKAEVSALLVKGQGVAQCYERPLWRACGDVDLLLDNDNYEKAIKLLSPIADRFIDHTVETKHYSIMLENWEVELHGTLHGNISDRIDAVIDSTHNKSIRDGEVRTWTNGGVDIFLPSPDNDIIFIFSHILQHFFHGGIGFNNFVILHVSYGYLKRK